MVSRTSDEIESISVTEGGRGGSVVFARERAPGVRRRFEKPETPIFRLGTRIARERERERERES